MTTCPFQCICLDLQLFDPNNIQNLLNLVCVCTDIYFYCTYFNMSVWKTWNCLRSPSGPALEYSILHSMNVYCAFYTHAQLLCFVVCSVIFNNVQLVSTRFLKMSNVFDIINVSSQQISKVSWFHRSKFKDYVCFSSNWILETKLVCLHKMWPSFFFTKLVWHHFVDADGLVPHTRILVANMVKKPDYAFSYF